MRKSKSSPLSIGVVTPSFNQARFLGQTIQSVLSQKYAALRYVVMDGGSTDDSVKILKKFGKKLQWVSRKDKGQSDAINKGFSKLQADIVAYINSDDYYLPGAFSEVAKVFADHPSVMWVVGDAIIVDEHGHPIQSAVAWYKKIWRLPYQPWMLAILNPLPQPAVFWRSSVYKKIGKFNTSLHYTMDYEYWLRIQQEFGAPYFLSTPLACFRIHGNSKGGSAYRQQFQEELQVGSRFFSSAVLTILHQFHIQCILLAYSILK